MTHPGVHTVKADPVERLAEFEAAHPDVKILRPGKASGFWEAVIPAGTIPDDPDRTTLTAYWLSGLMDWLDRIYPPAE